MADSNKIEKLLYDDPMMIRPIIKFLGLKSLLKILGKKDFIGLLMSYKVPNMAWRTLLKDLHKLDGELEDEKLYDILKDIELILSKRRIL